jgi:hypothetical protein
MKSRWLRVRARDGVLAGCQVRYIILEVLQIPFKTVRGGTSMTSAAGRQLMCGHVTLEGKQHVLSCCPSLLPIRDDVHARSVILGHPNKTP